MPRPQSFGFQLRSGTGRLLAFNGIQLFIGNKALLLRAGVAPAVLRSHSLDNERFITHRANIAQIVSELGWYTDGTAG
jgi:hypothetical protein